MPQPNVRTIRGAGHPLGTGDFTTIQAWEDWADDKAYPHQWAECYSRTSLGLFNISGWSSTTSASGYPKIYAASGDIHGGVLERGPFTDGNSGQKNTIAVNFCKVENIGSTRGFVMDLDTASNMSLKNCWSFEDNGTAFSAHVKTSSSNSQGNSIVNCIAMGSASGINNNIGFKLGGEEMFHGIVGVKCYNCMSSFHPSTEYQIFNTQIPGFRGGGDVYLRNCVGASAFDGADYSYSIVNGSGEIILTNNTSSDTTASDYGIGRPKQGNFSLNPGHQILVPINSVVNKADNRFSVVSVSGGGMASGVNPFYSHYLLPSGDFFPRNTSPTINAGVSIADVPDDIRQVARPVGSTYDVGPFEYYESFVSTIPLFTKGPIPQNSGIPLFLGVGFAQSGISTLNMTGFAKINSSFNLNIAAATPHTSGIPLIIGAQGPRRLATMYISAGQSTDVGGLSGYVSAITNLNDNKDISLYLQGLRQTASGVVPLSLIGFSGITAPNSIGYARNINVDSDDFVPSSRIGTMFAESEHNCGDGSLYKFDNNTNDNSDYSFKMYASGYYTGGDIGVDVTPMVESGFYQTSTRFPPSSLAGSGTARFIGGTHANIKMITNSTYNGTVLMQSGSPTIHDQHRIIPDRRGVTASFWINKKKGATVSPHIKTLQGVMGNLKLDHGLSPASGQWGIYYVPTVASASGTTPFNSFKDLIGFNAAGHQRINHGSETVGGIIPFVNTTAGGNMGRFLKTEQGKFVDATVPDTMLPLNEDRWYYIQYWIDKNEKSSYIRVASPAKGIPGQSGYMPEIKPITDKSQKWDGYEVVKDPDNLKFKVGGDLKMSMLPYFNLGYNVSDVSTQESFLIDEISLSNNVCSVNAMEEQFDSDYTNYIKQFSKDNNITLFIDGV